MRPAVSGDETQRTPEHTDDQPHLTAADETLPVQTARATRAITIKLGSHQHSQTSLPISFLLHCLYFLLLFQGPSLVSIVSPDGCLSENLHFYTITSSLVPFPTYCLYPASIPVNTALVVNPVSYIFTKSMFFCSSLFHYQCLIHPIITSLQGKQKLSKHLMLYFY